MFGFGRLSVAVVGTGFMASKMAQVLNASSTARPYAVVSRDIDRALSFGRDNGFKKAYDSLDKMLEDKKVDLVYICTPASEHAEAVRRCIECGKPVLCETPIALTAAEAESLFSLSSSLDVLVVEAVHTRFLPFFKQIVTVISSGAIGNPVMLTAHLASDMENLPRLQRPSLGGGALGDLGYLLLHLSTMLFGDRIKRIQSACVFTPARVDRQLSIVLQYKDDRMAVLSCTTSGNGESRAVIQGTKGCMVIEDLRNFGSVTVYDSKHNKTAVYKRPKYKSELEFELAAFIAASKSGWKECPEIPHAQTLSIMHMMDFIRRQLGISYEDIHTTPLPGLLENQGGAHVLQEGIGREPVRPSASETGQAVADAAAQEVTVPDAEPEEETAQGPAENAAEEVKAEEKAEPEAAQDGAAQEP